MHSGAVGTCADCGGIGHRTLVTTDLFSGPMLRKVQCGTCGGDGRARGLTGSCAEVVAYGRHLVPCEQCGGDDCCDHCQRL